MLRQIMVPLDGSTFAEQALPVALTIARGAPARLDLVLVRPLLPLDTSRTTAETYLSGIARRVLPALPDRITYHVLKNEVGPLEHPLKRDTVADVLALHAEEHDVDLIVMTTHGRGGVRRAWLGSVADPLMRTAQRPILLLRPRDESYEAAASADQRIRHIVIPLDGSELAERAIPHAQQLGAVFGARYTLLRVLVAVTVDLPAESAGGYLTGPVYGAGHEPAVRYLNAVAAGMRAQNLNVATTVVEAASPANAIIDHAITQSADLIVLSTAGAGGIRRLLLGSVADRIVRTGEVPLLTCNQHMHAHRGRPAHPLTAAPAEGVSAEAGHQE